MIIGYFDDHQHPKVDLTLVMDNGKLRISALVDTGFDGEVSLPKTLIDTLGLPLLSSVYAELADGNVVNLSLCHTKIQWGDTTIAVEAFATSSPAAIIGTELLHNNTLIINFPKKEVQIV